VNGTAAGKEPNQRNIRSNTIDEINRLELEAIERGTGNKKYKNNATTKLKARIEALKSNTNPDVNLHDIFLNAERDIARLNNMNNLQAREAAKMQKKEFNNQLNAKITAIRSGMKGKNVPSIEKLKMAVIGRTTARNWLGGPMPKNKQFVKMYLKNSHITKKIEEYMNNQANMKRQQANRWANNEAANKVMTATSGGVNLGPLKRNSNSVNAMRLNGKPNNTIVKNTISRILLENKYKNLPNNVNVISLMNVIKNNPSFNYNNIDKSVRLILNGMNTSTRQILPIAGPANNNRFFNKSYTLPIVSRYKAVVSAPNNLTNSQIIRLLTDKNSVLNKSTVQKLDTNTLRQVGDILTARKINSATYKKITGTYNK